MAKRICTHCKTENSETANYCRKCGFVLPGGSTEVSSDKTLISKIKDLQDKISEVETESKSKDNELINLTSEKTALRQSVSKLQTENGSLHSRLSSAKKRADSAEQEAKQAKSDLSESESGKIVMHILYIILVVAASIFGIVQYNNNQSLFKENSKYHSISESLSKTHPVIVTSIDVRNKGEDYGDKIYSRNTTYLNPRINVVSFVSDDAVFYVRLYTPYGLSQGDSSPKGYSNKTQCHISRNTQDTIVMVGWGNKEKGHWGKGEYRYEIYYKDKCIATKKFTIY